MAEISVIIPSYNRAYLISRAVGSVLNQTFRDFELIVVDDCSTDNTVEVVKSFNDKRIRYIRHEKNKGGSSARNTGIKLAKGEYIAFLDSDDEWLPEKIEQQIKILEDTSTNVGVVHTEFFIKEPDGKTHIAHKNVPVKERNIHRQLLEVEGSFVATPTIFIRKICFDKVGMFDENLTRLQDWELMIRISEYFEFIFIDTPLVKVHITDNSISMNQEAYCQSKELILEKHYQKFRDAGKGVLAGQLYGLGNLLCSSGEIQAGRRYLNRAVMIYPLPKYLLVYFISLFGPDFYKIKKKAARFFRLMQAGLF